MKLLGAVALYLGLLLLLVILCSEMAERPRVLVVVVPFYFSAGFILHRAVYCKLVEFHPVFDTKERVASLKLRLLLLWPVEYPVLFARILSMRAS